jgi:hypothetical protein
MFPATVLAFLLVSCDETVDRRVGPCVHVYEEPILHIESVRNAQTGAHIASVVLSEVRVDSVRQNPLLLLAGSSRMAVLDSVLIGNPPCAFGTQPGLYSFKVSASGFRDTVVTYSASYLTNRGGCPSSSTGGSRVRIDMQPL